MANAAREHCSGQRPKVVLPAGCFLKSSPVTWLDNWTTHSATTQVNWADGGGGDGVRCNQGHCFLSSYPWALRPLARPEHWHHQ